MHNMYTYIILHNYVQPCITGSGNNGGNTGDKGGSGSDTSGADVVITFVVTFVVSVTATAIITFIVTYYVFVKRKYEFNLNSLRKKIVHKQVTSSGDVDLQHNPAYSCDTSHKVTMYNDPNYES